MNGKCSTSPALFLGRRCSGCCRGKQGYGPSERKFRGRRGAQHSRMALFQPSDSMTGNVLTVPVREQIEVPVNEQLVVESMPVRETKGGENMEHDRHEIIVQESTPSYGKITIEPLEIGYGVTLGNSPAEFCSLRSVVLLLLLCVLRGFSMSSVPFPASKRTLSNFW